MNEPNPTLKSGVSGWVLNEMSRLRRRLSLILPFIPVAAGDRSFGQQRYKKNGFSIIEGTVAIVILIIGLLAVIQLFPFALRIIGDSQNLTTASNIALAKIEEISSMGYDNINTGTIETKQRVSSDPNIYLYNYQRQTTVEYVDSDFDSSPTDVGFKKITVTVFWQSPIGSTEKSIEINSLVSNY